MTGEGLVGLLPAMEPPAGFETRVMERLGLAAPAPSPARQASWTSRSSASAGTSPAGRPPAGGRAGPGRTRRRLLASAAAAVAVVVAALGGWGLRPGTSISGRDPAELCHPATASHQAAGKIYSLRLQFTVAVHVREHRPGAGNGTVICQVEGADGHITTVGSFRLTDGHGYWGSPVPPTHGPLTGARLVGPGGTVLATASFHSA